MTDWTKPEAYINNGYRLVLFNMIMDALRGSDRKRCDELNACKRYWTANNKTEIGKE